MAPMRWSVLLVFLLLSESVHASGNDTDIELVLPCAEHLVLRPDIELSADPRSRSLQCIAPCPSSIFSEQEYRSMLLSSLIPGFISVAINGSLLGTRLLAFLVYKKFGIKPMILISACLSLAWTLADVLPSAIFHDGVACPCPYETCYQHSWACRVSKASTFVLQMVVFWHTCLLIEMWFCIVKDRRKGATRRLQLYVMGSIGIPLLNAFIVFAFLETEDTDSPNYNLNRIRSSFKCFAKFPTVASEVFFVHMHFVICAILSTTIIVAICKKIFGVGTWAAVGRLAMLKKVTRLMCLGATSFTFLFINLAITAYAVPMIKQYAETETSWDSCFLNLVAIGAGLETTVETAVEVCGDMGDETRPSVDALCVAYFASSSVALSTGIVFMTSRSNTLVLQKVATSVRETSRRLSFGGDDKGKDKFVMPAENLIF